MANQDGKVNGANKTEGTPEQNKTEQTTEVTVVKKNDGIGTALKVGGGLLLAAAFTGLGWLLRGFFGGSDEDEDDSAAEAEHPEE